MKRLLKILLWAVVVYLLIGFLLSFIVGDNNFFQELAISPRDAFFIVYGWPFLLLLISGGPMLCASIAGDSAVVFEEWLLLTRTVWC